MEMRVIIHSPHESFDQASDRSGSLGFGLLRRINVADGSKADKPSRAKIHLCPLLSESGQNVAAPRMSAKCHERTHAPQQTAPLFDHLVGAGSRLSTIDE